MALKKCAECGGNLSSKAFLCPHCGARYPGRIWLHSGIFMVSIFLVAIGIAILMPRRDFKTIADPQDRRSLGQLCVPYSLESFFRQIAEGDELAVTHFLRAGMDPNRRMEGKPSALQIATAANHVRIIETLKRFGARE